ncbi:MAG: TonB-dependent receptor [Acidobacteria bacterium]|nr:TonB-dependent receptor [Acidobacteriota bacterium]
MAKSIFASRVEVSRQLCFFALLCLTTAVGAWAQLIPTGSITGTVKDPKGGVVPGAAITVTNTATGIVKTTKTNSTGDFLVPDLLPGTYRVEAQMAGFKKIAQVGTVQTGGSTTFDLTLQLGSTKQTVEVSSQAPLLQATTSALTTTVDNRAIVNLPLQGRNPLLLARLSPGVVQTFNPGPSGVNVNAMNQSSYFTSNGAWDRDNSFMIDGVPDNLTDRVGYIPPVADTENVTVLTNALDAQYGQGAGATVIVTTKSGTNQFHGTAYDFLQNSALNANGFFGNFEGLQKLPLHYNQFGGAIGGPIIHNRTFFFFNYEGIRTSNTSAVLGTVPTLLQRQGNFSQTYDSKGNLIQIYNPFSTRPDPNNPGSYIRDPFSGNIIPTSMINSASAGVLALLPLPNRTGLITGAQNYATSITNSTPMNDYTIRVDHQINDYNRVFVRFSKERTDQINSRLYPKLPAANSMNQQISVGLGYSHIFSPTLALDVALGWEGWQNPGFTPTFDMSSLGFSSSFIGLLPGQTVPSISIADMGSFGYGTFGYHDTDPTWGFNANMRKMLGIQSIKWGFQFQVKQDNSGINGDTGTYSFSRSYTQGPDPSTSGPDVGYGTASFLLGTMDNSSYLQSASSEATTAPYYGAYLNDDIRATSRLTLNLGVRWEVWLPATERFNHQNAGFAFDTPNPIAPQAIANYTANPIPGNILPPDQFHVNGGLLFATASGRRWGRTYWNDWSPRVGFAYKINNKTVMRGGFGFFRSMFWTSFARQTGFNSSTFAVGSLNGINPTNLFNNPFPEGFTPITGSSLGLMTDLGGSYGFLDQNAQPGYNARWNFGFQRQITPSTLLSAYYVGETAVHLPLGSGGQIFTPAGNAEQDYQLNYLPAKYLSLGDSLYNLVPNPFYGLISTAGFNGPTIHEGQLLLTYPEFGGLDDARRTGGMSYYHSLQITVDKRYSNGLSLLGAYTWSKSIDRYRFINASDPGPSKMIGYYDAPQRFTLGAVYDLPFGHGQAWGWKSGVGDEIIGGWRLSVNGVFQSGLPISLNAPVILTGVNPTLSAGRRGRLDWFNTAALTTLPTFSLRAAPWEIASLRADAINNWDTALMKNFRLTERFGLEFRWEMYNALNRVQFCPPDVNPASSTYGTIGCQANTPREMQMALKLNF